MARPRLSARLKSCSVPHTLEVAQPADRVRNTLTVAVLANTGPELLPVILTGGKRPQGVLISAAEMELIKAKITGLVDRPRWS